MHRCNNHCERIESSVLDAGAAPTSAIMGSAPFPQVRGPHLGERLKRAITGLGRGVSYWTLVQQGAHGGAQGGSREQHVRSNQYANGDTLASVVARRATECALASLREPHLVCAAVALVAAGDDLPAVAADLDLVGDQAVEV